jgi:hypothetical protein
VRGAGVRAEEVIAIVGEINRRVIDQILATGATRDEVATALAEVEDNLGFDDHRSASPSPRIAAVRALLEPVLAAESRFSRGRD